MDATLTALAAFHESHAIAGTPLVLATVIATSGSTYRKPGGRMLFSEAGRSSGLLSGGCMETDLLEHARAVLREDAARVIQYDLRESSDPIWGLGSGCEGAMQILLQPLLPGSAYRPFSAFTQVLRTRRRLTYATVIRTSESGVPIGTTFFPGEDGESRHAEAIASRCAQVERDRALNSIVEADNLPYALFVGEVLPPPRLLLLGGGPDAASVVDQASLLGWATTVVDHRPAYATAARFARAERVVLSHPEEVRRHVDPDTFDAVVVMSHHLPSDTEYLKVAADSSLPYVGLLGPAARRERLRADLGASAARLQGRLHGPVGLDIGATTPEAIALAIVAEIHAFLSGRPGNSFSAHVPFGTR
jgi:xanthine/CO dehydrogenase XdhC/CoxF family maturation factor